MKVKNIILSIVFLSLLTSCATTSVSRPTPAQFIARFCPVAQTLNAELLIVPGVHENIVESVKKVKPIVDSVCEHGANVTALSLQDLLDHGIPILLTLVEDEAVSSTPAGRAIMVAIPIAQVMLPQIIESVRQK
jgi:hypothetical protein